MEEEVIGVGSEAVDKTTTFISWSQPRDTKACGSLAH